MLHSWKLFHQSVSNASGLTSTSPTIDSLVVHLHCACCCCCTHCSLPLARPSSPPSLGAFQVTASCRSQSMCPAKPKIWCATCWRSMPISGWAPGMWPPTSSCIPSFGTSIGANFGTPGDPPTWAPIREASTSDGDASRMKKSCNCNWGRIRKTKRLRQKLKLLFKIVGCSWFDYRPTPESTNCCWGFFECFYISTAWWPQLFKKWSGVWFRILLLRLLSIQIGISLFSIKYENFWMNLLTKWFERCEIIHLRIVWDC